MFSWNPSVTGNVGRMIEIYNPNPLMTFGGMGSNKLVGPNIEYIANMTRIRARNSIRSFTAWSKLKWLGFPPRRSLPLKIV